MEPGRKGGLAPDPGPAKRAPPRGAGRLRERRKEKGDYGELQLAVCKRKYEGAEVRHGGPKPAAANANHLAYELAPGFLSKTYRFTPLRGMAVL